ncbi:hypothetical protein [Curtobacterium sp. ISL-83]|uniref:hypothetical protein n=1 Tax=Curtobacterium sp. ISL-83 TaxID=2819145 RepID=UPI001BE5C5E9|nr:hypothetical protein [Curtobacterium sp. ISL-83]MBT2501907.1 hypothetical protein [Curtobacterium sp. ISL-83]
MERTPQTVITAPPLELDDPVRLFHGVGVERRDWDGLDPIGRRRLVVRARAARLQRDAVVSHRSAAALWGLPEHDRVDWRLHVIDTAATKTHSGSGVVRHVGALSGHETVVLDGIRTTTLERTLLDLLHTMPLEHSVIVLDHALRKGGVTREALVQASAVRRGGRGSRRATRALEFADPAAESPGESLSRLTADRLGAPAPVLQQEFVTEVGRFRVDFWWPDAGVIGEFDGRVKYDDPEALWAEKRREDALRRAPGVRSVARWGMSEAEDPVRLGRILIRAGVPLARGWTHLAS